MKCAYHPDKEASAQCARCKKPLCEECSRSGGDSRMVLCGTCLMQEAATNVTQALDERNEQKEARRQERELRARRKSYIRMGVILAFAVAVLIVNLYLYLTPRAPVEQFDPNQDPYLTAALIESAILDYADSHEGEFPRTLDDLLGGDYLPSDQITGAVLQGYVYTRPSPRSYELRIKDASGGVISDIVFNHEGVNP